MKNIFVFMFALTALLPVNSNAAARGSGSYTTLPIGSAPQRLYLVATREEPGWLTDASTNSINQNFVLISSAVYRLETIGGNTNYILLQATLQSGAVFFVSSGTANLSLNAPEIIASASMTATQIRAPPYRFQAIGDGLVITSAAAVLFNSVGWRMDQNGNFGVGSSTPIGSFHIGKIDMGGPSPAASAHISTGAGNQGAWLQNVAGSSATLAAGARWNGSSWIATAPQASIFEFDGSSVAIYSDVNLTAGTGFVPTVRGFLSSNLNRFGIGTSVPRGTVSLGTRVILDDSSDNASILRFAHYNDGDTRALTANTAPTAIVIDQQGFRIFADSSTNTGVNGVFNNFVNKFEINQPDGAISISSDAANSNHNDAIQIGRYTLLGSTKSVNSSWRFNNYSTAGDSIADARCMRSGQTPKLVSMGSGGLYVYESITSCVASDDSITDLVQSMRITDNAVWIGTGSGRTPYQGGIDTRLDVTGGQTVFRGSLTVVNTVTAGSATFTNFNIGGTMDAGTGSGVINNVRSSTWMAIGAFDPAVPASFKVNIAGTMGSTPAWNLHGSTGPGRQGGWVQGTGSDDIALTGGAFWNGGSWQAAAAAANVSIVDGGVITINTDTNLTVGSTFTPSARLTLDGRGLGLGIGATTPNARLRIGSGSDGDDRDGIFMSVQPSTSNIGALGDKIRWGFSNGAFIASAQEDSADLAQMGLVFYTHPDTLGSTLSIERFKINSQGAVGIGSTSKSTFTAAGVFQPILNSNCETATPVQVGEFCSQNSATCPLAIATGTATGAYACLTITPP